MSDEELRKLGRLADIGDREAIDQLLRIAGETEIRCPNCEKLIKVSGDRFCPKCRVALTVDLRFDSRALDILTMSSEKLANHVIKFASENLAALDGDENSLKRIYDVVVHARSVTDYIYYRFFNLSARSSYNEHNARVQRILDAGSTIDKVMIPVFSSFKRAYYANNPILGRIVEAMCLSDNMNRDALLRVLGVGQRRHIRLLAAGRFTLGRQVFVVDVSSGGAHRLKVICPGCEKLFPIGRIGQHGATHFPGWMHRSRGDLLWHLQLSPEECINLLV
jgi:hypothetical protein